MRAAALITLGLVVLAIACAPEEGRTAPDASITDASEPDAPSECMHECSRSGLRCRGGMIIEVPPVLVSCDTTRCPDGEVVWECERGCPEGLLASEVHQICDETRPKAAGDPCVADVDCEPALAGTLVCDGRSGTCIARVADDCNGHDDDFDGMIDERCTCSPRLVATVGRTASDSPLGVSFGPDRIVLLRESEPDAGAHLGSLIVTDGSGATITEMTDLPGPSTVTRTAGEHRVLLQDALGVSTLIRLRDDGTEERVVLQRSSPVRPAFVHGDDSGWTMISLLSGRLTMTRHTLAGERTAIRTTNEVTMTFQSEHAGGWVVGLDSRILRASATLELSEHATLPLAPYRIEPMPLPDGRTLLLVEETTAFAQLVTLHPDGTIQAHGEIDLRPTDGPKRAAVDPATERVAIAARHAGVRVALYEPGSTTPSAHVVLQPTQSFQTRSIAIGHVGTGFRVVVGHRDAGDPAWTIFDPCPEWSITATRRPPPSSPSSR
ncbi:hypothetical protein [Sandaracinus amylolyticus]|nr:hypothetical protein [Sandaracinus amylolyticus]